MREKIICLIPARGGSKRIPRKNIKNFMGKPMISYPIKAAIKSKCFTNIIVSTDNYQIANVAESYGAEIPYMRPAEISNDDSTSFSVVRHYIKQNNTYINENDIVCFLYATAILIGPKELESAINYFKRNSKENLLFSTTLYSHPIERAFTIDQEGKAAMSNPKMSAVKTQDCHQSYHDAGQFYIARVAQWKYEKLSIDGSIPYILPNWLAHDIDTEEDFIHAQYLYEVLHLRN